MLIVNADDLGRSRGATDRAIACFAAKRISSGSAMVFMADSTRALGAARDAGLPVGLHLNLSEAFSASNVPADLRLAHDAVRNFLNANRYALVRFSPRLTRQFEYVTRAQIEEFERLFGQAPTHIDGHQHMHLATNVLLQKLLPEGAKVRRNFSSRANERNLLNRSYRLGVDWLLKRRHRLADYFFSLSHFLAADQLLGLIALAKNADVEVMTHPERDEEFELLMSDFFARSLLDVDFGGYDLLEI